MLIRRRIGRVDFHRCGGEGGFEIADGAIGGCAATGHAGVLRVRGSRAQVILAGLRAIAEVDQSGGGAGLLEGFGNHEGDGEPEIAHRVGIERGLCAGEAIRQVNRTPRGLRRCIVLGQNEQHAGRALCIAHVHANDAALADRRGHDETIRGLALGRVFERVLCPAGHLQRAVDAIERATDRTGEIALRHGRSP